MTKLEEYINWREKEFIEKYEKVSIILPDEQPWNILEAEDKNGMPIIATISSQFKNWKYKAAFPWRVQIDISFKGNKRGFPNNSQMQQLQEIEDQVLELVKPTGLIYLGHETNNHVRSIFSYTSDYKLISKIIHSFLDKCESEFEITFFIKKDKYWRTMDWYFNATEKEEDVEDY